MTSGASLVVLLDRNIMAFEKECRHASKEALLRAREILLHVNLSRPEWMRQRSLYGVSYIDNLLEKGDHG
jgi:hypothetical protein